MKPARLSFIFLIFAAFVHSAPKLLTSVPGKQPLRRQGVELDRHQIVTEAAAVKSLY